jgi:hypothetical protein
MAVSVKRNRRKKSAQRSSRARVHQMTIRIAEEELRDVMTPEDVGHALGGGGAAIVLSSGGDTEQAVVSALPKALGRRLKRMSPADFGISEFELSFELTGKVFGMGLSGTVKVVFVPRTR